MQLDPLSPGAAGVEPPEGVSEGELEEQTTGSDSLPALEEVGGMAVVTVGGTW